MTNTPTSRSLILALLALTLALTGCGTSLQSDPLFFGTVDVGTEVDVSIACTSVGLGDGECVATPQCSNCAWQLASGELSGGFTLQIGEDKDLKVTPTGAGPFSLTVTNGGRDAGPDSGTSVDGTARAVQNLYVTAEPPAGGFVVGEPSTVTLRLDASGSRLPVTVSSIAVARTVENGTFALSSTSESLAAGAMTTVTATVTPATNTSYLATITVTSDDPLAPTQQVEVPVVLLAGIQVERPVDDVIEHQGIDLVDDLSETGGVFTYVVRNTAPVTVEVLGCSASDESNVTVSLPDGCTPASLETLLGPGDTAEYAITVNPNALGEFDFNLEFRTDYGRYDFTVAGEAIADETGTPDIRISAPDASGTLQAVPSGSTDSVAGAVGASLVRQYTITNAGSAPLSVLGAAVGGTTNATASVSTAPGTLVLAGGTTAFEVTYLVTAPGPFSVALQVTSDDPDTPLWAWDFVGTTAAAAEDCGDQQDNDGDSLVDCDDLDDCSTDPSCTGCVDLDLGSSSGVGVFSGGPGDLPMTFSVLPTAGTCWEGSIFQTGSPFDATFEVRDACGAPPIVSSTDFPIPGAFVGTQFDVTPGNNVFLTVVPDGLGGAFELDVFQNVNTVSPDANLGSALGQGLHTISGYANTPGQSTTANPFGSADAKVDWTAPSDGRFNFIVSPSDPGCVLSATLTPASTCSDIGEIATSSGGPGEPVQVSTVLEAGDTVRLAVAPSGSGGEICGPDVIDIEQGEQFCADGADDDGDSLIDCDDSDCAGVEPCSETSCADGADNDGDSLVDCADPDCLNTTSCPWDVDIGAAVGSPATTADTTGAGDDHLPPCNGNDGNDVLFRWEAPSSGCFTFDTVGSTDLADTVLTVRDENLAVLGCDDDAGPGFLSALQVCSIVGGDTYFIALDAFNAAVNGVAPLNITAQP